MASKLFPLKNFCENKGQIQETRNPDYCDCFVSQVIKATQVHRLPDQLESDSVGSKTGLIISLPGQNDSRVSERLDARKQPFER